MNTNNQHYGTAQLPFSSTTQSDSLLFISGQGGIEPTTGDIPVGDLEAQTILTIGNIERLLKQHGLTLRHLVKVTIYLKERALYEAFNQVYTRIVPPPYPARTVIYCDLNFDLLVEIDAIASLRNS
ncbi:RidA family protein [Paenibacillus sp. J5C_2022]|uniref:RidA family protein n=1 Tax=Paenibacillus sp. J5C2022 TaxID=2977129 RepID=UPI0021D0D841|nr:RidA family protein [Paenibacillus sp. J5C2022]MCU6711592.1 RidA family protein [Paenibacillus sp. J5C2022]